MEFLRANADEQYRVFTQPLTNDDSVKYIGVRMPAVDKLAKEIAADGWREYIKNYDRRYFECRLLHGKLLSKIKADFPMLMQMIDEFLPYITSWAICDTSIRKFRQIAGHERECLEIAKRYTKSENQWAVRVGLRLLFANLIGKRYGGRYIDEILAAAKGIKNGGYYAQMMNAWLIAECCISSPSQVERLLAERTLNKFTQNKAIQKIKESNRIALSLKNKLTQYKI